MPTPWDSRSRVALARHGAERPIQVTQQFADAPAAIWGWGKAGEHGDDAVAHLLGGALQKIGANGVRVTECKFTGAGGVGSGAQNVPDLGGARQGMQIGG